MFLELLTAIVVSFLAWLYVRWSKVRQYWAKNGVSHLPPHPIFGSLTFLQKINPGRWMIEMYNRFNEPYVGIWLFWRPALIINDPEIARRVLVKDSDVFRDRFLSSGKKDPIGGLNLFTANDPLWTSVRRRLTAVFTASKLRALEGLISHKAKQLVERFRNEIKAKQIPNTREIYTDYTSDIIGISSFGIANDAVITGDSPIRNITKTFQHYSPLRGLAFSSIFFFPELVDIFGFTFFPKSSTDYFTKVFKQVVAQRGGYENAPAEGRDLLDALIKMKQNADKENEDMPEEVLIAQAVIFIQGGFETSGAALTYATYELAHHPDIQERLYEELRDARGEAEDFNLNTLSELTYLNCVMKETLRKYPAMGWLDRIAARSYKIDDKLIIPAGMPVYVNAIGMHHDPKYFPDPLQFDPDRFLPENEKNIKPFTFMPFGEGPRNCIGTRFAYQVFRFALASVVFNLELRAFPNSTKPSDCVWDKRAMFLLPGERMDVEMIPRDQ